MSSISISDIASMGGFYRSSKKKRKPCPSEEVAKTIDKEILRECLEEAAEVVKRHREEVKEVYEDTVTTESLDEVCCVEEARPYNGPPIPSDGPVMVKMKVPRGLSKGLSYGDVCGDSSNARATLEDWDMHGIRLVGRIYEDKRGEYPDGKMIYTETVKSAASELKEGAIVRTRNNYYLLGKQHIPNDE